MAPPSEKRAHDSHVVQDTNAEARLAQMGYKQELPRSLSMISILGLSFAIMAVPFGSSTTLALALTDGGAVTVLYGWIIVSLISLAIAASLAEICSVFPTAGGVYYWSHMLASPRYAPIASWTTGWFGLVGNWTVTASINFSLAQLILSAIGLWRDGWVATPWQTLLCYWAVMIFCALVNVFANRWLDRLNTWCIYWTAASVVVIIVTLLVMADDRRSGEFVFSYYDASAAGWPSGWAFFVGLLQAAYTLTGYGMVAAMCEEVQNPEREVPKAMVLSVAAAAVTGIIYLVPILFVLPDIPTLLGVASGQPMPLLYKIVTGSPGEDSACCSSLSELDSLPVSAHLPQPCLVSCERAICAPCMALALSTIVDCLLGFLYLGSSAAFNAFTGVATICLSVSYGIPILVSLLRGRKLVRTASYSLGKFGFVINILTICWISLAIVLFTMPTAIPVTPQTMNYASVVFAGFTAISAVWYVVWGRKHYRGPQVSAADFLGDAVPVAPPATQAQKKSSETRSDPRTKRWTRKRAFPSTANVVVYFEFRWGPRNTATGHGPRPRSRVVGPVLLDHELWTIRPFRQFTTLPARKLGDLPQLERTDSPDRANTAKIDERCWFYCTQSVQDRFRSKRPVCYTLCWRRAFPHESHQVAKTPQAMTWSDYWALESRTRPQSENLKEWGPLAGRYIYFSKGRYVATRHMFGMKGSGVPSPVNFVPGVGDDQPVSVNQKSAPNEVEKAAEPAARGAPQQSESETYEKVIALGPLPFQIADGIRAGFDKYFGPTGRLLSKGAKLWDDGVPIGVAKSMYQLAIAGEPLALANKAVDLIIRGSRGNGGSGDDSTSL
ncbi:Amino acid permease [Rhizoctonia solani]|uniref:Amino acid permease n=1 Tax=Rhizoctonia solani TaxID=456999 RepID=A0A8H7M7T0_9AGAM|nr:Amino acid permease [Rhizoctonia solani]